MNDFYLLQDIKSYKEILKKYSFDYLIVDYNSSLFNFLKNTNNYCIVYSSNEFFIFKYVNINEEIYLNNFVC